MATNLGTTNDFIANSKLTIMSEQNIYQPQPQIVLTQTKDIDGDLVWDNNYLQFKYIINQDNNINYFGITEQNEDYNSKLNFELAGNLNFLNETQNNTIIHSQYNFFNTSSNNNLLLNSNSNTLNKLNDNTFIKSTENEFRSINESEELDVPNNISFNSFIQSNNNIITLDNEKYSDTYMSNMALLNSKNNYIIGNTKYNGINDNKATLINNNHSYYHIKGTGGSTTIIGGAFNYIVEANNFIGIGEGLLYEHDSTLNSKEDKIILGYYNAQNEDPDDFFIVGDGGISEDTKNRLNVSTEHLKDALDEIKDNKEYTTNYDYYRHNLFTVNKKGYITISNYQDSNQSAKYGFDGITATNFDGGNESYEINFAELHKQMEYVNNYLNTQDIEDIENSIKIANETMASYTPISSCTLLQVDANTQLSAYLNLDRSGPNISSLTFSPTSNYGILNIKYVPKEGGNDTAILSWTAVLDADTHYSETVTAEITANKPIQLLYKNGFPCAGFSQIV